MPKKSNKRRTKGKRTKTRKQNPLVMIGCSKKNNKTCKKHSLALGDKSCPNCGPNCHCGPNCKCPHPCPGNCYLNRRMKKQKGGSYSGCGSCGCPIAPLSTKQINQFGGNSASYPEVLNQTIMPDAILGTNQNGGAFYKPIGPMPGPITGSAWGPDLKWPGMNGVSGDRNYLAPYKTDNDPQQQMSMNDAGYKTMNSMIGGYTYNKKHSSSTKSSASISKKGGALVPQDLLNLGRDFNYNFTSAYNALNGYKAPVDPLPYKGQLTGTLNNNRIML